VPRILSAMPGTDRFPALDWTFAATSPEILAEAVGHAWVQARVGGSVTVAGPALAHPWWPVLRAWLPDAAPLRVGAESAHADVLPQRPYPPVALNSLPRDGSPAWGAAEPWSWLAAHEPWVVLAEAEPHPALAIALGAVASWGWRVIWRIPDLVAIAPALAYLAQRQLPLHVVPAVAPATVPPGWWPAPRAACGLWLQHEWPTIHLPV
jgi:hypothetical protein